MKTTPRPPAAPGPPRPARVLLVEDDGEARADLGELITLWGHRAVVAESCDEALALARAELPDIALIDLGLPKVSGLEVARGIRAIEAERRPPRRTWLVALTGYGAASDRRLALEAGFDQHLVKPIDPSEIEAVLARARP